MDVTSKTEGRAFADSSGVPLLVKYDTRIRDGIAKAVVEDVNTKIQVNFKNQQAHNHHLQFDPSRFPPSKSVILRDASCLELNEELIILLNEAEQ